MKIFRYNRQCSSLFDAVQIDLGHERKLRTRFEAEACTFEVLLSLNVQVAELEAERDERDEQPSLKRSMTSLDPEVAFSVVFLPHHQGYHATKQKLAQLELEYARLHNESQKVAV